MLSLRYISCAPYLAKPRKHEIHGVSAENAVYQSVERCVDPEGLELYAPPHGPDYVRQHGQQQAGGYPAEIALGTDDVHHLFEIYPGEQQIAQSDADNQRYYIFHQLSQAGALLFIHE